MRTRASICFLICYFALSLSGCSGLFYFPSREIVIKPSDLGLPYEDKQIISEDGTKLHAWLIKADQPRALVVFFHGNAQNIAYHLPSIYWLPAKGVSVLTVDFRGYGLSEGEASQKGLQQDIRASVAYGLKLFDQNSHIPVFVFAQSLGGSTAIAALSDNELCNQLAGMIVEGAFSSYHLIAREKLQVAIFTWPFAWPLSYLVSDRFSPREAIAHLSPLRLLIAHGQMDEVVQVHHGQELFEAANQPKEGWFPAKAGHIECFKGPEGQEVFLSFIFKKNT